MRIRLSQTLCHFSSKQLDGTHIEEASVKPVARRWKWNLSDVDPTTKELVVDTLLLSDEADKAG